MRKLLIAIIVFLSVNPAIAGGIDLGGDVRLRYQYQDREGDVPRARGRIRFRLKGEADITDGLSAGFRFATGSGDPVSTNQTLGNSFETYDLRFDYGYIRYMTGGLALTGGKFTNGSLLWTPSDLIWGGDVNPDGIAASYKGKAFDYSLNTGLLVLDESGANAQDPFMYLAQIRAAMSPARNVKIEAAATYYGFENLTGRDLTYSAGTNTLDADGLVYEYNSMAAGLSLTTSGIAVSKAGISGEYINNPDSGDLGWLGELSLRDSIAGIPVTFKYGYRMLERDAWIDTTQDGSTYRGRTGIEGSKSSLKLGLKKADLDIVYFDMKSNFGQAKPERLLQVSVSVKM